MLIVINSIGKTTEKFVFYFTGLSFSRVGRALFNHYAVESRLSLIVRVNVVLTRTVAVDSDWRFDNLCGCHLQKESVHLDDQTQPTFEMTPGFKPFTVLLRSGYANALFTGKRFILWIVSSTFGPTGTWTAKQAIYNGRPERLRSELNYLTANQFICTERSHKEWYSMFIYLVQRLNCDRFFICLMNLHQVDLITTIVSNGALSWKHIL